MMANRRQYHIFEEWYLPYSNLWSTFSRLLQRSAEVLALYSSFHSLLLRGGSLKSLGLSFMTRWTVLPYLAVEQGFSQVQATVPPAKVILEHLNFILPFAGSVPSLRMGCPSRHMGTPSSPMVKSSLYTGGRPLSALRSMKGTMPCLRQYS